MKACMGIDPGKQGGYACVHLLSTGKFELKSTGMLSDLSIHELDMQRRMHGGPAIIEMPPKRVTYKRNGEGVSGRNAESHHTQLAEMYALKGGLEAMQCKVETIEVPHWRPAAVWCIIGKRKGKYNKDYSRTAAAAWFGSDAPFPEISKGENKGTWKDGPVEAALIAVAWLCRNTRYAIQFPKVVQA